LSPLRHEVQGEEQTMSDQHKSEDGKRLKLEIAGENYYLIATRGEDGGIDYFVTVPDMNKNTGLARR
jgi:hypothetical protein